jgi:hypothetical protein
MAILIELGSPLIVGVGGLSLRGYFGGLAVAVGNIVAGINK